MAMWESKSAASASLLSFLRNLGGSVDAEFLMVKGQSAGLIRTVCCGIVLEVCQMFIVNKRRSVVS